MERKTIVWFCIWLFCAAIFMLCLINGIKNYSYFFSETPQLVKTKVINFGYTPLLENIPVIEGEMLLEDISIHAETASKSNWARVDVKSNTIFNSDLSKDPTYYYVVPIDYLFAGELKQNQEIEFYFNLKTLNDAKCRRPFPVWIHVHLLIIAAFLFLLLLLLIYFTKKTVLFSFVSGVQNDMFKSVN